jgi:hypothetical protein
MPTENSGAADQSPNVNDAPDDSDTEATQNTSERGGLSGIASDLVGSMPDVQPHAIQARRDDRANNATAPDVDGTIFDPAIHAVDDDGKPKKTLLGKFAKKRARDKGVKNSGTPAVSRLGTGKPAQSADDKKAAQEAEARNAGAIAAGAMFTFGMLIGGEEWQPIKDHTTGTDEAAMMAKAFGDYFAAKGMTDIPPGVALCIAIGGYIVPRCFMPKTQTRFQKIKNWIGAKYIKWKARRAGVSVEVEPNE